MADYISREALSELAYWHGEHPNFDNPNPDGADVVDVSDIEAIPAADVVEVVRCKDCKHKVRTDANGIVICSEEHGMYYPTENDFCSYGKRRNEQ